MIIDANTDLGRLRLRVADFGDIALLPDSVYSQTLEDKGGNLNAAAKTCALYILGILSQRTHRKLAQLEIWGAEAFQNYRDFLLLTVSNPALMDCSPIPYSSAEAFSPILDFQKNWNKGFAQTEAQQLAFTADISPNDNSRTGAHLVPYV